MILIFGGSYNGKLKYAREKYNLSEKDIFYCTDNSGLNYDKKVICGLHIFIRECIQNNINPIEIIKKNLHKLKGKIIICDEINSGIVPLEKKDREYRETCGEILQILSFNSKEVYRIFFGIENKMK